MHFLLWTEGSHQGPYFDTTECSGENLPNSSCHFTNYKSVFLQTLHHSSVSWKITCLHFFSVKRYTLCTKRNQLKSKFWGFWVVGSKFTKFLSFLKQHTSSSSNFASCFRDMRHNSLYFFSWNFLYFQRKEPIKIWWNFTWAVESLKFCTFLMGSL